MGIRSTSRIAPQRHSAWSMPNRACVARLGRTAIVFGLCLWPPSPLGCGGRQIPMQRKAFQNRLPIPGSVERPGWFFSLLWPPSPLGCGGREIPMPRLAFFDRLPILGSVGHPGRVFSCTWPPKANPRSEWSESPDFDRLHLYLDIYLYIHKNRVSKGCID